MIDYVDVQAHGGGPELGSAFGVAVLALGIGGIAYIKKFFPDEVSVQQRHDGPSDELTRKTAAAQLEEAGEDTGVARRPLIRRTVSLEDLAGRFAGRRRHQAPELPSGLTPEGAIIARQQRIGQDGSDLHESE